MYPGSLVEIKYLSCGDTVSILGSDRGYLQIQAGKHLVGFVEEKYIRRMDAIIESSSNQNAKKEEVQQTDSVSLQAYPSEQPKIAVHKQKNSRLGIEFGAEFSPTKYQQYWISPDFPKTELMKESGNLSGFYARLTSRPKKEMISFEGKFSLADFDFIDAMDQRLIQNVKNHVFESRLLAGRIFNISESAYVIPMAGVGYRYRYDGMGQKPELYGDYRHYDRKSHFLYSPIGMEILVRLGNGWALGASAEYDYFWRGWLFNKYEDSVPERPALLNFQDSGWGGRASVRLVKRFGRTGFAIEPFLRYWDIKLSELGRNEYGEWQEPPNKTQESGTRFGVEF